MKKMRLSPVDHLFTGHDAYPVEFLIKFPNPLEPTALQKSLQKAVKLFWPLMARLNSEDGKNFDLIFKGEQPKLNIFDWSNEPMPDLKDAYCLAKFSVPVESISGTPLSTFNLYQLKESSALVVNISHCLVDGYSYFFFLASWANLNQQFSLKKRFKQILTRPKHKRALLIPKSVSPNPDLSDEHFFKVTGSSLSKKTRHFSREDCQWEFFDFPINTVKNHRENINKKLKINEVQKVSCNDVLSALILKRLVDDGRYFKDKAKISSAFDYRRIIPSLGPLYFGNAIRAASFEISILEVKNSSLKDLALKFRDTTNSITREKALDSLALFEAARLAQNGGMEFIQSFHVADPSCGFLITNLSRVRFENLDFGNGPPNEVIPLTPAPRTGIVTKNGDSFIVRVSPPKKEEKEQNNKTY